MWLCRWGEPDIKVGEVLLAVDGKEPSSLSDALKVKAGLCCSPRDCGVAHDHRRYLFQSQCFSRCSKARRDHK